MGVPISDLDLATDIPPEEVVTRAEAAGIKAVPTGISHGTVTLVLGNSTFEVTTFRKDIETDGRHAVVKFSGQLEDDAWRRDFTMNALYLSLDGRLIDPTGGLADAERGHVRFIGDPKARIAEDYLRILRFFRFTAHYGATRLGMDEAGLAACAEASDGLDHVSAERSTAEMLKLLGAQEPSLAIGAMAQSGVLGRVLPGADPRGLAPLVHLEGARAPDAIRRLAVLGGDTSNLRLSRKEAKLLTVLHENIGTSAAAAELGYRLGASTAISVLLLRAASLELPLPTSDLEAAEQAATETFPVAAADLSESLSGPALGAELRRLEAAWIASNFSLTKDALLKL